MFFNNVIWHATSNDEKEDIIFNFGKKAKVKTALNVPVFQEEISAVNMLTYPIKLVFLGRIASIKNLHLAIESVANFKSEIFEFDIYGPIEDEIYYQNCVTLVNSSVNKKIIFKGILSANEVKETLKNYHFLIFPTQGENFGHTIAESLSVGLPVLIGDKTPWYNVANFNAGFVVEPNLKNIESALYKITELNNEQYLIMQQNAIKFFEQNINFEALKNDYFDLFTQSRHQY